MEVSALSVISLVVLVVTIVVGIKKKINLGVLGLAVAFVFGFFVKNADGVALSSAALGGKPFIALLPTKIFWPIIGISLMLNIGNENGAYGIAIRALTSICRGRRALMPLLIFAVMAAVVSLGLSSAGVNMLLITIAISIAYDQDIDPVFMFMSVLCGCFAGCVSPLSTIGIINNGYYQEFYGTNFCTIENYLRCLALCCLCMVVLYIGFKGFKLEKWPVEKSVNLTKPNREQAISLIGLAAFVVLALVFKLDLALSGILVATVMVLLGCADIKKIIAQVPWATIVMICGMCILVGVVQQAGGLQLLTDTLKLVMNKWTVKPIYALIGGILGLVSSMTSVICPTMLPTIPDIAASTGVAPAALFLSLTFVANTTAGCPFNSLGGMACGVAAGRNKWDNDKVFRGMLWWSLILMVAASVFCALGVAG